MDIYHGESILKDLKNVPLWDIIIIVRGAMGLGIALDSITRCYKTPMVANLMANELDKNHDWVQNRIAQKKFTEYFLGIHCIIGHGHPKIN